MRKLTNPVIGMIVYLCFPEFNIRCEITDIYGQNIWVVDAGTYRDIGWHPIDFFVEEDKHNWLHEGF